MILDGELLVHSTVVRHGGEKFLVDRDGVFAGEESGLQVTGISGYCSLLCHGGGCRDENDGRREKKKIKRRKKEEGKKEATRFRRIRKTTDCLCCVHLEAVSLTRPNKMTPLGVGILGRRALKRKNGRRSRRCGLPNDERRWYSPLRGFLERKPYRGPRADTHTTYPRSRKRSACGPLGPVDNADWLWKDLLTPHKVDVGPRNGTCNVPSRDDLRLQYAARCALYVVLVFKSTVGLGLPRLLGNQGL